MMFEIDRAAVRRVSDPAPIPTRCPHCASPVDLVPNAQVYGRAIGNWPYVYACRSRHTCNSYVGLHAGTDIPLGTLATAPMRLARRDAKEAFNQIWQHSPRVTRSEAYRWLAGQLGIATKDCHISMLDVGQCYETVQACNSFPWPEVVAGTWVAA